MSSTKSENKKSILFLLDERLPHERARVLTLTVNALRTAYTVQTVSGGANEEVVLNQLSQKHYDVVLLPWYRYLAWTQIQNKFLQAPNEASLCSYSAGSLFPYELGEFGGIQKFIHFDFCHMQQSEILQTIKLLSQAQTKSGLTHWIQNPKSYYFENWTKTDTLGQKIDALSALPEFKDEPWKTRVSAVQLLIQAVWNWFHLYRNPASTTENSSVRFEMACSEKILLFRFCFPARGLASKDGVRWFWPNTQSLTSPSELLLKYCDLLRVHPLVDQEKIEVTVAYFTSAPMMKAPQELHSLWIEPLHSATIHDSMAADATPLFQNAKKLPAPGTAPTTAADTATHDQSAQLLQFKKALMEKDEIIHDLRAGGIAQPTSFAPPETEQLLGTLSERFLEIQLELKALASAPASDQNRRKLEMLREKETIWRTLVAGLLKGVEVNKKAS